MRYKFNLARMKEISIKAFNDIIFSNFVSIQEKKLEAQTNGNVWCTMKHPFIGNTQKFSASIKTAYTFVLVAIFGMLFCAQDSERVK